MTTLMKPPNPRLRWAVADLYCEDCGRDVARFVALRSWVTWEEYAGTVRTMIWAHYYDHRDGPDLHLPEARPLRYPTWPELAAEYEAAG